MYGYFDESIIIVDGIKYMFLGFIVFQEKPKENVILKEFTRTKSKLQNKIEIKYSNVRDSKIKELVVEKIKSNCLYFASAKTELMQDKNVHGLVNSLVKEILSTYFSEKQLVPIEINYDKVSYQIDLQYFYKQHSNIKKFIFRNSTREIGIQYADWIVGNAGENFKNSARIQSKQKSRP